MLCILFGIDVFVVCVLDFFGVVFEECVVEFMIEVVDEEFFEV